MYLKINQSPEIRLDFAIALYLGSIGFHKPILSRNGNASKTNKIKKTVGIKILFLEEISKFTTSSVSSKVEPFFLY